jgi:hypothetical protein
LFYVPGNIILYLTFGDSSLIGEQYEIRVEAVSPVGYQDPQLENSYEITIEITDVCEND